MPRYRVLASANSESDADRLVDVFRDALTSVSATLDIVEGPTVTGEVLEPLVSAYGISSAVLSAERDARLLEQPFRELGVRVLETSVSSALEADLGATSARAAVAVTGSLVLDSSASGGRTVSLLPAFHLCIVAFERLVATPSDFLRKSLGCLPSAITIVTGPSRTGDIEQLITLGAHGPRHVHVVLTGYDGPTL